MSTPMAELQSPVPLTRRTSLRKLTKILRPSKTRRVQPSLSIPRANSDGVTPPSSPSLYSLSSDSDSRPKLSSEVDRPESHPQLSPTSNTLSSSASEGHGNGLVLSSAKSPVDDTTPDLGNGRAEPISPTVLSHKSQRSPSADYTWAMNRAYEVGPKRIITTDKHDRSIDSDTSSLRVAGKWGERAKLQPLSPSEWIGSNVLAKKAFLGGAQVSPVESENRSPLNTSSSSSSSSPATPRPRPISANNHPWAKPGGDLDAVSGSDAIPEVPEAELLTEYRRRPRSASEPRSFLASPIETFRHSGTVPSTPTEYIIPIPDLDSGPKSSQTISPPPRQSSLSSQMPDDVYFTAAGRRESRMYISPDAGPNYIPPSSPMRRGHAHSSSVPLAVIPADPNQKSPAMRYATWSGSKKEPTSGRPFENLMRGEEVVPPVGGDSTPVSRKEEMWSGNWNRDDIQDVIRELRSLK